MSGSGRIFAKNGRWTKQLFDLEQLLLNPEARHRSKAMETLLHPDFIEFGSSGGVYDRQTMIEMMTEEVSAEVIIRDFDVRALSGDTALVTYRSIGHTGQEARRSSIWVQDDAGWRLVFHQGTRISDRWRGLK